MQVTLNALPASLAEFRNLSLKTPDEVVAGFLCALNLYVKNPNEGVEAMNLLRGPRPMTPYDSQFLRDRLRGKEYLPLAYFAFAMLRARTGVPIGHSDKLYPYPFLDYPRLGAKRFWLYVIGILAFFFALGGLFVGIGSWLT